MKKVLVFVGTRPEAIKLAPVINELKNYPDFFNVLVCSTGQHKEMLNQTFLDFNLVPDINFNLMTANQTLASLTSVLFERISRLIENEKPDWIIVQGDTTTVMVASLCGFYSNIPVVHIEAGLRSFNKFSPFPEEINRKIVSAVADLHFCPTTTSRDNLLSEGIDQSKIFVSGNTCIDAITSTISSLKQNDLNFSENILDILNSKEKFILITSHRRENLDSVLRNLCDVLLTVSKSDESINYIYPVHLNPRVRNVVYEALKNSNKIVLCDPLPYRQFIFLMSKSFAVITDSGGIQEEALSLNKPVLVVREETERPEGIIAGGSRLIGTEYSEILKGVQELIENDNVYESMVSATNPYGDGNAAARIVESLISRL